MNIDRSPTRFLVAACLALAAGLQPPVHAHETIAQSRRIDFPDLPDGRKVLAVDLHTHSVFSDGSVWPDIRVEEARRDALAAFAVSEHLEGQPHSGDIPHPDRNRPYEIASEAAAADPTRPLLVINGTEITKAMPEGHINAVFVTDANAVMGADARRQVEVANAQGAFVFWNHPFFYEQVPDAIARMTDFHAGLIREGLLHGVEVANGLDMSDDALQIALDHNLAILGTSDIHGLIDWDHDVANGGHRTATLVLAKSASAEGLKAALKARETVAIYNDNLVGRRDQLEPLVRATLRMEVGDYLPRTRVVPVVLFNDSPVDYVLQNVGPERFYDEARLLTVPARSSFRVVVSDVADPARLGLTLEILNSYMAPRKHLVLRLDGSARR